MNSSASTSTIESVSTLTPFSRLERAWYFALAHLKHVVGVHTMIPTHHLSLETDIDESHEEDGVTVITAATARSLRLVFTNECLICGVSA